MGDYATRADLDRVHQSLSKDLLETERLLRERDDEKERGLRAEFVDAIERSDLRTRTGFDEVKAILVEQNRWIMRRRVEWRTWRRDLAALTFSGAAVSVLLHFVFGVAL